MIRWPCILLLLIALCGCGNGSVRVVESRLKALEGSYFRSPKSASVRALPGGRNVVFISVCDGKSRATTFRGVGASLEDAWRMAYELTVSHARKTGCDFKWVRTDLVDSIERQPFGKALGRIAGAPKKSADFGFAADCEFEYAVLEPVLNCREEIGLGERCRDGFVYEFTAASRFVGEDGIVRELESAQEALGRRRFDGLSASGAEAKIDSMTRYLLAQLKEDGAFAYGFNAYSGEPIPGYNIVRHAGTLWALSAVHARVRTPELGSAVRKAAARLLESVVERDAETAYVRDDGGEFKLGGSALAIVALETLMEVSGETSYAETCRKLGNGIVALQNRETGVFTHVLKPDFSVGKAFSTVYFDGEAALALCRLYARTRDRRWLDAAKKAIDSFIARDYIQYRDHWLSYCLEAFTGFSDDPKYYDYALRNVQENLAKIESNTFHAPVCLEMMMAGFKTYLRMKDRGIRTDYLDRSFDPQSFVAALDRRLERMENYWLHPEVAMFMAHPDAVVGTYMVRNSNCRIRIDDEQHSIGGLLLYAELCGPLDALRQTKPESKRFCARR